MTTGISRAELIDLIAYALRHKAKIELPHKSATGERYDLLRYRIAAEQSIDHMQMAGVVFDRAPPRQCIRSRPSSQVKFRLCVELQISGSRMSLLS